MSRNSVIALVSIFLIIVLGITFIICSMKISEMKRLKQQSKMTDYLYAEDKPSETKDLYITKYLTFTVYKEDNTELNLSEYENNPVMILFFDDEDRDSIEVLDEVEQLYPEYQDKVKFLMINTSKVVNYELKHEYSMEIFYDFYEEAARKYGITEFPSMIYIAKDNTIFNSKTGYTTMDALEANLDIISENY